jgi:hypothetical protein
VANTKTSDESAASALTGSELVRIVQSGSSVRTTAAAIAALGGWSYTLVTGTTATLADSNRVVQCSHASGATTLTLPTPSAGRMYIIQKIDGTASETITLARAGSEKIDNVAASRVLYGTDNVVDVTGYAHAYAAFLVTCDGTDWWTFPLAPQTRAVWQRSGAPVDATDSVSTYGWLPGSFWHQTSGDKGRLYLQSGNDAGDAWWIRADAVRVQSISSNTTLPGKDTTCFVNTGSGVVTLTLPSPTDDGEGRQFCITKTNTGTNKITLARHASESINGSAANLDLPGSSDADYGRWHVVSDGTNWWVTGGSALT